MQHRQSESKLRARAAEHAKRKEDRAAAKHAAVPKVLASDTIEAALARLAQLKAATQSFSGFCALARPTWTHIPQFHLQLIDILDKFEKDQLYTDYLTNPAGYPYPSTTPPNAKLADAILITMPPRHSKTQYATVLFPSYYMARDPARAILSSAYNSILAADFGKEVREVIRDPNIKAAFSDLQISKASNAVDSWRTTRGGIYNSVGLNATTTGRPANLLLIDDPIKNREEAKSKILRAKLRSYYSSALRSRMQPTHDGKRPKQIICLTRWDLEDLAGYVQTLEEWGDRWLHITMPALTEISEADYTKLTSNEHTKTHAARDTKGDNKLYTSLWPERFPPEELFRIRRLSESDFQALYQQSPFTEGGGIIKTQWFNFYNEQTKPPRFAHMVAAVDTAYTANEDSDYTVAIIMGVSEEGEYYVVDRYRARVELPDLKRAIITLNAIHRPSGLRAWYFEEVSGGSPIMQAIKADTGLAVLPYFEGKRDKVTKAHSITPLIEAGRVYLPEHAPWINEFLDEIEAFPNGRNDDQVDALVMALDICSRLPLDNSPTGLSFQRTSLNEEYALANRGRTNTDMRHRSLNSQRRTNTNTNTNTNANTPTWNGWGGTLKFKI